MQFINFDNKFCIDFTVIVAVAYGKVDGVIGGFPIISVLKTMIWPNL